MGVSALRQKYLEMFGEPSRSGNKAYLFKKLAWRIQSLAEGGLSERARRRAEELARDADLRTTVPRPPKAAADAGHRTVVLAAPSADGQDRLPIPGTVLTRTYRGKHVAVTVLTDGFEFDGQTYKSLSAISKAVTGSHWNGYLFFGLGNFQDEIAAAQAYDEAARELFGEHARLNFPAGVDAWLERAAAA